MTELRRYRTPQDVTGGSNPRENYRGSPGAGSPRSNRWDSMPGTSTKAVTDWFNEEHAADPAGYSVLTSKTFD